MGSGEERGKRGGVCVGGVELEEWCCDNEITNSLQLVQLREGEIAESIENTILEL